MITIRTPLTDQQIVKLHAGDRVLITGYVYTARDSAHKRMVETIKKNEPLPFDIKGAIIYYVGPTQAKPGYVIGSAGPTTSPRMDKLTPPLLQLGLKGMIGKGKRSGEVVDAIVKYKAIYLGATGGAGALLAKRIKKVEIVAYKELGPEAIRKLEVEEFPAIVVNDVQGNDLYEIGRARFASKF
jgi:fumarate hydratase subunit beta